MDLTRYLAGLALLLACMLVVALGTHLALRIRASRRDSRKMAPLPAQEEI